MAFRIQRFRPWSRELAPPLLPGRESSRRPAPRRAAVPAEDPPAGPAHARWPAPRTSARPVSALLVLSERAVAARRGPVGEPVPGRRDELAPWKTRSPAPDLSLEPWCGKATQRGPESPGAPWPQGGPGAAPSAELPASWSGSGRIRPPPPPPAGPAPGPTPVAGSPWAGGPQTRRWEAGARAGRHGARSLPRAPGRPARHDGAWRCPPAHGQRVAAQAGPRDLSEPARQGSALPAATPDEPRQPKFSAVGALSAERVHPPAALFETRDRHAGAARSSTRDRAGVPALDPWLAGRAQATGAGPGLR